MIRKNSDIDPQKTTLTVEEREFEQKLRPETFSSFAGQKQLVDNLKVFVEAARQRNEALDHVLLHGPPGLGKTTLAYIIAHELKVNIITTSGPALEKPGDIAGILNRLQERDVLFIDEIHRLNHVIEEYLYSAMEDYKIEVTLDSGPNARSYELKLNPFTLIGATTRTGSLTDPLRSRFGIRLRLDYYDAGTLTKIVNRSAKILQVEAATEATKEIARRSRGTPRIANNLLKRIRDFADIQGTGKIDLKITQYGLDNLSIDKDGLDEMDNLILQTIIGKFNGGPVGLKTIAVAVNEEPETIEEVYEPFLIKEGYLKRSPRGREITPLAYSHLGIAPKKAGPSLF